MTGTVESAAPQVITDLQHDALQFSFPNTSGARLTEGQEVILKSDGTLDKRDAGTELPIGIVVVPAENNERATVRTFFTAALDGIVIGGAIAPGAYLKPNGVKNADGLPQYVAAVAGDYSCAQAIKGGAINAIIKIGILKSPVIIP